MEARRHTWTLGALLLASLSCHVVSPDAPGSRGLPSGREEPPHLLIARASEGGYAGIVTFLAGLPTGLNPGAREAVARTVVQESVRSGLPVELVLAVILVESGGDARAVSHAGAIGLMQLRPATAEVLAAQIGLPWSGPALLFDPVANVRLGVAYLEQLIQRYRDLATALAAYNWGPARIEARLRRGQRLPRGYPSRVLAAAGPSALQASRT